MEIKDIDQNGAPIVEEQQSLEQMLVEDYVLKIQLHWQKSLDAIIEVGHTLVEAKTRVEKGTFLRMIEEELPFGDRTAQRLMKIVEDKRIMANATHASYLPNSWMTLYELTKLSDDRFQEGLESGQINADMSRKQVSELLKPKPRSTGTRKIDQPQMVTLVLTAGEAVLLKDLYDGAMNVGAVDRWIDEKFPKNAKHPPNPLGLAQKLLKKVPTLAQLEDQRG